MKQLPVAEFKANFSKVLEKVLQGQSIGITYGKSKKKIAAIIPYKKYIKQQTKLKLGLLQGKAHFTIHDDFKMTDEELLQS